MDQLSLNHRQVFEGLREKGVGVNLHYIPVHLHPYYQQHFGTGPGLCPRAEAAYQEIMSLPMWEGDRFFLPLVFDDDPRIFHGFMPYDDARPISWHYSRI